MKHIIFYHSKGGVGKTSLAYLFNKWLISQGYETEVINTDKQVFLESTENEKAEYIIYDTQGVMSEGAIDIFTQASANDMDYCVIVPINQGETTLRELPATKSIIDEYAPNNTIYILNDMDFRTNRPREVMDECKRLGINYSTRAIIRNNAAILRGQSNKKTDGFMQALFEEISQ